MNDITVVIPISPIKSHPSTRIIDETLASVRHHLHNADVILTFDGVRQEQEHYREAYENHKTEMLRRCLREYKNVLPVIFEENLHQSGMMKAIMDSIRTPLILYVEQDAPLTIDREIDWDKCRLYIYDGNANTIRFHFEEVIPEPHEHMMISGNDDGFIRTIQWSQRPHLSTKLYYEEMLKYFPENSRTFIEDEWHGVVINDYERDDLLGWYKHRLVIYAPSDGRLKRSYTTDGREGDPKFGEGFKK